jgi:lysozyme family protein
MIIYNFIDDRFENAFAKTYQFEKGYVCDPDDPGGETNDGISKRSYPDLDIRNLTMEQKKEIYFRDYWLASGCDKIRSDEIASKIFDLAVNMGPFRAGVLLQIAMVRTHWPVVVDGKIGPQTLSRLNVHPNSEWLLAAIRIEAVRFYVGLGSEHYERGWVRRAIN